MNNGKQENEKVANIFNPEGRQVILPEWIWSYLELKAEFYCMPVSAFILMLVQREMELTSSSVQHFIEMQFFAKHRDLPEIIDPFDSSIIETLKLSHKFKKSIERGGELKESILTTNTGANCLELAVAQNHFLRANKLGFFNKLREEGWIYDKRFNLWRTKYRHEIKSKDIGLAQKMIDILNNINKKEK